MKESIIYNRTSTEEQNPKLQLSDCEELSERLQIKDYEVLPEKKSAWKENLPREVFDEIVRNIRKRQVKNLIVWDLDRIYRNRKKLVGFFETCKVFGCKVFSYRQQWLEDINKAPEPWNEMLFNNMIFILGWIAEEESSKKSERVRAALKKREDGQTISKYGNIWGRKKVPMKILNEIINLYEQGKPYREICNEVYYWDRNKHKKNVSMGLVHKTVEAFKREKFAK